MDSEETSSGEESEIDDPEEALKRFRQTLFECADTIKAICEQEEDTNPHKYAKNKISPFIALLRLLLKLFNPVRLAQHYCRFVLPYKDKVEERDRAFFIENDNLYPGAPKENLVFFKQLWLDFICSGCQNPYYERKKEIGKTRIYCDNCGAKTKKYPATHFHFNEDEQDAIIEYFETMLDYCEIWKDLTDYTVPEIMDGDTTKA